MRKMDTAQLTLNALLAALCAVLGYVAIDIGYLKVTFESVPVIMAGLMFGPVSGALVGGIGTLIYQLLRYGVSVTTLLWMLPYIAAGAAAGLYAKKSGYKNSNKQICIIVFLMEILIFVINTVAIYVDSVVYGYFSVPYVFGALIWRFIIAVVKGLAFGFVMPQILKMMSKITHNGR